MSYNYCAVDCQISRKWKSCADWLDEPPKPQWAHIEVLHTLIRTFSNKIISMHPNVHSYQMHTLPSDPSCVIIEVTIPAKLFKHFNLVTQFNTCSRDIILQPILKTDKPKSFLSSRLRPRNARFQYSPNKADIVWWWTSQWNCTTRPGIWIQPWYCLLTMWSCIFTQWLYTFLPVAPLSFNILKMNCYLIDYNKFPMSVTMWQRKERFEGLNEVS